MFLDARRVVTHHQVAQEQVSRWLEAQERAEQSLPARQTLVAADSRFSTPDFIYPLAVERGTNVLVRVRSNRVFFCPPPKDLRTARGHPRWYGERFVLDDPATWPHPDADETWEETTHRGRRWSTCRRGDGCGCEGVGDGRCIAIRVWITTPEGEMVHSRPLWLALFGPCQEECPLQEVVRAYLQRSHQEHGH